MLFFVANTNVASNDFFGARKQLLLRGVQKVYRVFDDEAAALGKSLTSVNSNSIANYRNAAGLPVQNTGRFVTEAIVKKSDITLQREVLLTYIYDATGSKLAAKLNSTVNNFYTGAVVYKGDKTIDYIPASTGLIRKVGSDFVRQYNINDHLGNVRAVVNQSGTIEQVSDYYPYGLAFNYNNLDKNRYLYNERHQNL